VVSIHEMIIIIIRPIGRHNVERVFRAAECMRVNCSPITFDHE